MICQYDKDPVDLQKSLIFKFLDNEQTFSDSGMLQLHSMDEHTQFYLYVTQ